MPKMPENNPKSGGCSETALPHRGWCSTCGEDNGQANSLPLLHSFVHGTALDLLRSSQQVVCARTLLLELVLDAIKPPRSPLILCRRIPLQIRGDLLGEYFLRFSLHHLVGRWHVVPASSKYYTVTALSCDWLDGRTVVDVWRIRGRVVDLDPFHELVGVL